MADCNSQLKCDSHSCAGKLPFSHAPPDDRQLPDMHMALYNTVVVFDQATKLAYVITWVHLERHASLEEAYQHGQEQLTRTGRKLQAEHSPNLANGRVKLVQTCWPFMLLILCYFASFLIMQYQHLHLGFRSHGLELSAVQSPYHMTRRVVTYAILKASHSC